MTIYSIISTNFIYKMSAIKNGSFVKSPLGFSYYIPNKINVEQTFSPEVYALCIKATNKLAELRAYSSFIPDVNFFIKMHIAKESIDSNKIEGTKTEIDDLFVAQENLVDEKKNETEEVLNYIKALNYGIERMQTHPLTSRLLKECHSIMLQGVRGQKKTPGEFRKSQNWIGGATLSDAHFIPPEYDLVYDLISDLEYFIHNNSTPDLIKIGLAHYQFETIHPFLDGNGRIGRLMIILFLIHAKLLHFPVLYLSQFFEQNKSLYYQNLDITRSENGYEKWLKFFLVGLEQTALFNLNTLQKIVALKSDSENKLFKLGKKAQKAKIVLDHLFSTPVINVSQIVTLLGCTKTTANSLVADLVRLGILVEKTNFSRNRNFAFQDYLNLFGSHKN
jgi:Fic family protein